MGRGRHGHRGHHGVDVDGQVRGVTGAHVGAPVSTASSNGHVAEPGRPAHVALRMVGAEHLVVAQVTSVPLAPREGPLVGELQGTVRP